MSSLVMTEAFKALFLEGHAPIFKHKDAMYFRYDRIDVAPQGHGARAAFWCDGICVAYIPIPGFTCTGTLTLSGVEGRLQFRLD